MEIINAAPIAQEQNHSSCQHSQADEISNPAVNYGEFTEAQQDLQAAERAKNIPAEVPEILVNGIEITESQVLGEMQYHPADTKRQSMVKAAEYLIIGELIKQKADELAIDYDPMSLDTASEYQLINQLIAHERITPSASTAECQRFYQQNKGKFTTSPLVELRHILLAAAPDDVTERIRLKDVAEEMINRIQEEPACFNDMVTAHSACPSKAMSGNLGQVSQGQTVAEFERHIFKAQAGLIDYPIETRYGFHIVLIERKIDGAELPFDYVKDKVSEYLNEKVKRKTIAQYMQQLIKAADIKGFNFDYENSPLIQ
ncbi:peptidylprolyl isomerase [Thalassotalea insulae]|uniref:peptidylprolyl isomerase n=1 Tax=Thalassotalea insulae TaxID=2056778 RepID=A0ABQ6GTB0_9GAMM|nr:peptidylprolyl isomerase [Thalassotalea insulae]GLX77406.1 peptidylprolyl isomerase [Thalassotalea insulae]